MQPIRLGLVGYGKIAQDQHVPAINADPGFRLVAVATQGKPCAGVENFHSLSELLENGPEVDAIAFCTPPQGRFALLQQALAAGKHVLVEKPPCATLGEAMALVNQARQQDVSALFAWHSRYAPGIEAACDWLASRTLQSVQIDWKEDVRKWHPGQAWIWQPGGLGVFDPGINALSIATHLLPLPLFVESAELRVPANCQSPIAASIKMSDARHLDVDLRRIDAGHRRAEARHRFRDQTAAAADVEEDKAGEGISRPLVAAEMPAGLALDVGKARRTELVQRLELAVRVPPLPRHRREAVDLGLVDAATPAFGHRPPPLRPS